MQQAIDKALCWGNTSGLSFSAAKTQSIIFHRKRRPPDIRQLEMNGTQIKFDDTVKYLGVTLDQRLTYGSHIKAKIKNAKGHMLRLRNAMGQLWGPSPKMTRWLYLAVVRPALSYGSFVWAKGLRPAWTEPQLNRVNRLALMSLGFFRKGTPTAGLEVIAQVSPLSLHIEATAVAAFHRAYHLCTDTPDLVPHQWATEVTQPTVPNLAVTAKTGHLDYCRFLIEKAGIRDITSDRITPRHQWEKEYVVDKSSYHMGIPLVNDNLNVFTDGSRQRNLAGCGGVVMLEQAQFYSFSQHLGGDASVFQAEVFAIKSAAEWIKENCLGVNVTFYVDSRAALQALDSYRINSKLTQDTRKILNEAASNNSIKLRWIKAHAGHRGNEIADYLAKSGAANAALRPHQPPLPPHCVVQQHHRACFQQLWNDKWRNRADCRQTKHWFPEV